MIDWKKIIENITKIKFKNLLNDTDKILGKSGPFDFQSNPFLW